MQARKILLVSYGFMLLASLFLLTKLKFTFDFEQFFPKGDPDWEFFKSYIKDFESDDNFLLVAVERKNGVFDRDFLTKFHDFTLKSADLPHVTSATSLTKINYPLKTPFGITTVPAIHVDDTTFYATDREKVLRDQRFVHNLISEDATAINLYLKTINQTNLDQAKELMGALEKLSVNYGFEEVRILGRARFQQEMVRMEKREVMVSSSIAALLVCIVLFFIFRTWQSVMISIVGIGLSMMFFLGILSVIGMELNALAALYPVLICIVGVADTIHIQSKYVDELEKGHDKSMAIRITLREIGLATFITCITTALGFASLITNRTAPIQGFGLNAALGVVVAFFTIYGWLWAVLPYFSQNQLIRYSKEYAFWGRFMDWTYRFTKVNTRKIALISVGVMLICLFGISKIHTNYNIKSNLPRGQKITSDFLFFEEKFSGFRPVEFAVFPQGDRDADDFEVLKEMDKLEQHLRSFDQIRTVMSINDMYRTLNMMSNGNQQTYYQLPDSLEDFERYKRLAEKAPSAATDVLLSKNKDKARIAVRMTDAGRDSVEKLQLNVEQFIREKTDSSIARFKMTGTGLILDKNSIYIRDNMLQGLIPSVLIVALLMAFLYRNWRIVLIFIVPNVFPLFMVGAMIGFMDIPLEAGIATVFSIVFGIATDDTIHFLSTFKICRDRGLNVDESIKTTLAETGKAMCLSSIILFFSFMVMLFSIHLPSVIVGILVSITLAAALFCDLFIAPIMLRALMKD